MWLPLLSALLGIIAFLPVNFYPVSFIWLVPLFIFFLREKKFWRLVFGALIFRLIFFLGTVYFTLEPIAWSSGLLIFSGLPVMVWAVKKIVDYTSFFGAKNLFFERVEKLNFWRRSQPAVLDSPAAAGSLEQYYKNNTSLTAYRIILLIFLPFLWTFFDLLQARWSLLPSYIITAGNMLGSSPFVGLANFGGIAALTFFVAMVNALGTGIVIRIKSSLTLPKGRGEDTLSPFYKGRNKYSFLYLLIMLCVILSAWRISQYALGQNTSGYNALPRSFNFAAISVNEKFNINQLGALKKELTSRQSNLVIFPENIFKQPASSYSSAGDFPLLGNKSTAIFQNLAKELDTNIITAFDTIQGDTDKLKYNSAVLFNNQGEITGIYNKNRLTFIGEYWPFGSWRPALYDWLRKKDPKILNYAIFDPENSKRQGEQSLLSLNWQKKSLLFATAICLEIDYPADFKRYQANGAEFVINQTSNRWIDSGTNHFLYLTNNLRKIEAVWLRLPIIVSGVKDFAGLVLPDGQARMVDYETGDKNYEIYWGEIRH